MTRFYIDSLCRIYSPNIIYCVTFIVKITLLLLLQNYNYNNYYITCSEDHYYTVIITTICDWLWENGHIRANNDFSV